MSEQQWPDTVRANEKCTGAGVGGLVWPQVHTDWCWSCSSFTDDPAAPCALTLTVELITITDT